MASDTPAYKPTLVRRKVAAGAASLGREVLNHGSDQAESKQYLDPGSLKREAQHEEPQCGHDRSPFVRPISG